MIKILIITFFVSIGLYAKDDGKIDLKNIKKEISKKESGYYYPDLMAKYIANDTSLTLEDYKYLFYGFTFQPEYIPYGRHDSLEVMNSYWGNELISPNFKKLFELSGIILEDFPFDFRAIGTRVISAFEIGDSVISKIWYHKYDKLIRTILSSGDGKSYETAFLVTQTSEEYEIVHVLGFYPSGQSLVSNKGKNYDLIDLTENEFGLESLYFDIDIFFGKLF
ncbi:MAG: DUF4919 domain-containing protein [Bacteroidales bacterium]|nr:DUF4919 domain-containing protein [Bacteroidales bacterium]